MVDCIVFGLVVAAFLAALVRYIRLQGRIERIAREDGIDACAKLLTKLGNLTISTDTILLRFRSHHVRCLFVLVFSAPLVPALWTSEKPRLAVAVGALAVALCIVSSSAHISISIKRGVRDYTVRSSFRIAGMPVRTQQIRLERPEFYSRDYASPKEEAEDVRLTVLGRDRGRLVLTPEQFPGWSPSLAFATLVVCARVLNEWIKAHDGPVT